MEEKRYNEIDMETTTFDDTDSFELSEDNKVIKFDAGYEAAKNKDRGIQSNIGSNTLSFNKLDFSDENYIPSKTETIKNKYNFKSWDSDVIVSDKENHASIYDGCKLSYAKLLRYEHNDMEDLERQLPQFQKTKAF